MRVTWGLGWALCACVSIACGPGSSAPDSEVAVDSSVKDAAPVELPSDVRPSPDGIGYCCSGGTSGCDCAPVGGFVIDPAACSHLESVCDAPPPLWVSHRDEHGCEYYTIRVPQSDDEVCHLWYVPDSGVDGGASDAGAGDAGAGDAGDGGAPSVDAGDGGALSADAGAGDARAGRG